MKVLFLHPNFPSQFREVALALARDPRHQVVFITAQSKGELPGVRKLLYPEVRAAGRETHPYLHSAEQAILHGQAAWRLGRELGKAGFVPDLIYGHSGFGPTLFMKDLFPKAPLLCQFEWYYRAEGSDADFDPAHPLTPDVRAAIRMKNAPILLDLAACDGGNAPTYWQHRQFPEEFQRKIEVCHEGIDTDYFSPVDNAALPLPRLGLDFPPGTELVTYVARGMEPYRGFPQFIRALQRLQQLRPQAHAIIVGDDRVAYGRSRQDRRSYKTALLEEFPLDPARTHFTGVLSYADYRQVLRASSVHTYLTVPFVLSWSLLEAMSTGCLLVASDTAPVREVIEHGREGILTDFFAPETLAARLAEVLERPREFAPLRARASALVRNRYALRDLLPQRLRWMARHAA